MIDKINARQAGILCAVMLFANKLLMLPGVLFREVRTDGFLIYLLFFVLDILVLFAILWFKKRKKDVKLNKVWNFIIHFALIAYFLVGSFFMVQDAFVFIRDSAYEDVSLLIFAICFLPVAIYAATTGFRGIARTAEFYYKFIVFGIIVCLVIGVSKIDRMPDFFTADFSQFSLTMISYMLWFTEFVYFAIILSNTEDSKDLSKTVLSFVGFAMGLVLVISYTFYALYPNTGFLHGNSILDISKISSSHGGIGNLDIVALLVVTFLLFMQFSVVFRSFVISAGKVLKIGRSNERDS